MLESSPRSLLTGSGAGLWRWKTQSRLKDSPSPIQPFPPQVSLPTLSPCIPESCLILLLSPPNPNLFLYSLPLHLPRLREGEVVSAYVAVKMPKDR